MARIHAYRRTHEQHFVRHTGWLAELIRQIEMTPFRARISGTAGCGKSLMASVFTRAQTEQDRRVLTDRQSLVRCHHRYRYNFLRRQMDRLSISNVPSSR